MQQIEGMLTQPVAQPSVGRPSMAPNCASLPFAPTPSPLHLRIMWHDDENEKENTDPRMAFWKDNKSAGTEDFISHIMLEEMGS